jgi:hypothetical protein
MDPFLLKQNGGGALGARSRLKITATQTGTGNPPVRLIASPPNIGLLRRRLGVIFYRERTGPHPINACLIEHGDGLIVVDTGDTARKSDRTRVGGKRADTAYPPITHRLRAKRSL